jgi:hypothetical protein
VTIETFSEADAMLIEADGNVRGVTPVRFRVMPEGAADLSSTKLNAGAGANEGTFSKYHFSFLIFHSHQGPKRSISAIFLSLRRCRSSPVNPRRHKRVYNLQRNSSPITRAPRHNTLQSSCSRDWWPE